MSKLISGLTLLALMAAPAAAHARRSAKTSPPSPAAAPEVEAPPVASAPPSPPPVLEATPAPTEEAPMKRLGLGYKVGNGLGFIGGDVIVGVVDHVTLDLQLNYDSEEVAPGMKATGWGFGGEVQGFLKKGWKSSPFVAVGLAHASMHVGDATGSATGYFVNGGYEFRWDSGVAVLLGAGVGHMGKIEANSPTDHFETTGGAYFNIEAGLRYMIF